MTDQRVRLSVLEALTLVRGDERVQLALAFVYFFCVLGAYYVLRPIRDAMGIAGGTDDLPWLFLGTLLLTLIVSPIFAALVARMPRARFVTWSYRGLMLCLLLFFLSGKARAGVSAQGGGEGSRAGQEGADGRRR